MRIQLPDVNILLAMYDPSPPIMKLLYAGSIRKGVIVGQPAR